MNIKGKLFLDNLKYNTNIRNGSRSFTTSIVSIIIALIFALILSSALGYNPFEIISDLFTKGFQFKNDLFIYIGLFALSGLAFAMTARAGIFNIGISGQMLASGTAIVFFIKLLTQFNVVDDIPSGAGQLIIVLVAIFVGAMVALFIGLLDVYLNVNSVVSSILLNWIIYFVCFFLLTTYGSEDSANTPTLSYSIPDNFRLIDTQWGTQGIIPVVILVVIISASLFFLFKFTVFGHKIKSIGLSSSASQAAGYKVKKIKLSAFALSGVIAGILACVNYTSFDYSGIPININADVIPTEGFDGIAISLIASNNPIGIVAISSLFGLFRNSSIVLPKAYFSMIIGFMMLGAALSTLIIKFKPWKYIKSLKYNKQYYLLKNLYDSKLNNLVSKYKVILKLERQNVDNQHISNQDKDNLWNEIILEINQDYDLEMKKIKKEYRIELWKLLIDKHITHIYEYHSELHTKSNEIGLKSIKKITRIKEKNHQYNMNLTNEKISNSQAIKYQSKIDLNNVKVEAIKHQSYITNQTNENLIRNKWFKDSDNTELMNKKIDQLTKKANKLKDEELKNHVISLIDNATKGGNS